MDIKQAVDEAVKILKEGGVILYPTDTIWGLGCDATNPKAVEKLSTIKKCKERNGFIILADNADMICRYVKVIPEVAIDILEVNDKPLTIIYPGAIGLAPDVAGEDGTISIRVVDNEFCKALIYKFRRPIVSTSANFSGDPAPADYDSITEEVRGAADWIAHPKFGRGATGKPSSMIKLGVGGEVKIIRK